MTQRDAFFEMLKESRKNDDRIVIISDDMGAASLNEVKNEPWYINIGASEQLAISTATGLALKGYKPYVYMISSFVTRAFEQIHLMASMNLPITIVSVGAGLSYDTAGATHHAINDLNALRTIPNMTIVNISSLEMARYYAKQSLEYNTPLYIRLDKKINHFYAPFSDFGWQLSRYGLYKDLLISTGVITNYILDCLSNFDMLEINRFPCNEKSLLEFMNSVRYDTIISIEENYSIGGLGDYLLSLGLNIEKVALTDFCEAKPRELYWEYLLGEATRLINK